MLNKDVIIEILTGYHLCHGDRDITYAGTVETKVDTLYLMRVMNMGGTPYSDLDEIYEDENGLLDVREVFSNPRRWEKSMIRFAKATAKERKRCASRTGG